MNTASVNGADGNRVGFAVPVLSAEEASSEQLKQRILETLRVENRATAVRLEAVTVLRRREGRAVVEAVLREDRLLARRRVRSELETAQELESLPKTREGLKQGDVPQDNARIMAAASQRGDISEDDLIDRARSQPPERFSASVRKHERTRSEDDGVTRLEHQHKQRFAQIKTSMDDGMTVLYGRFDPITGARIKAVLSHKMNQLWHKEDTAKRATAGQRMADALDLLLTHPGEKQKNGYAGVRLLLMADYDTTHQQLHNGRLPDGTPIPAPMLRQLACDAQVLPAIFSGNSQPLDLGRARRAANTAQRAALIARDKHCIGCGATADWCQAHHIEHWQHGGPTNLNNLTLLCSNCHHNVHDKDWKVTRDPTGKYTLQRPPRNHPQRRTKPRSRRRRPTTKQRK